MILKHIYRLICFGIIGILLYACYPEQDVAPIDSPSDNALVTIEPIGDHSNVSEGDTLWFSITVDKMVENSVDFGLLLQESSTVDGDDFAVIKGVLGSYSLSTKIGIVLMADALPETGEMLNFKISSEEDISWNWQLNPDSDVESEEVIIKNYDYSLDWSGTKYKGKDMCEWSIDLDMYVGNEDFSAYNADGATSACPLEHGTLANLPDDTYDIYVDYYGGEIPDGAGVDIPYVATLSHNSGDVYTIKGTFNSNNVGESRVVGQLVISDGVYTIYDDEGKEIGTI